MRVGARLVEHAFDRGCRLRHVVGAFAARDRRDRQDAQRDDNPEHDRELDERERAARAGAVIGYLRTEICLPSRSLGEGC